MNLEIKSFEYDVDNDGQKEMITTDHRFVSTGYTDGVGWRIGEDYFCEDDQEDSEHSLKNISPFFSETKKDTSEYTSPYYFTESWQLYVETVDNVDYLVSWNVLNRYYAKANGYAVTAYQIGENQSLTPVYSTYIFIDSEYILIQ